MNVSKLRALQNYYIYDLCSTQIPSVKNREEFNLLYSGDFVPTPLFSKNKKMENIVFRKGIKLQKILYVVVMLCIAIIAPITAKERIISLAPALTDIIVALDKGDELVGVTNYCDVPDRFSDVTKIGGFLDANYERIITLKPTIAFVYDENTRVIDFLIHRNIPYVAVAHRNINDIYTAIDVISTSLNAQKKGESVVSDMQTQLAAIAVRHPAYSKRKKVMLVIGRDKGSLQNMYIAGGGDFLSELLILMNAENVYGGDVPYPKVSIESVVRMNPDVIVEFLQDDVRARGEDAVKGDWKKYTAVRAVRDNAIKEADPDYKLYPSTRIVEIAQMLERLLYE